MKGLVQIQMLMAIEKALGRPIKDCFEWISGTSVGGIIALLLCAGNSICS